MGLFDRFRKKTDIESRQFFPLINQTFGTGYFSAEKNAAVDRAVSRIANTISTLPIEMYQWTSKGIRDVWSDPIAKLLKNPAVEETYTLFWQTAIRHLFFKGNLYIFKHRNQKGDVVCLEIIDPTFVLVTRAEDGRKLYHISGQRGGVYTDRDVIHIPLAKEGYGGTIGTSPLVIHNDLIQQNSLLQEFISLTLNRGVGSRLLITLDKDVYKIGSQKVAQLVSEFSEYMQKFVYGQENAMKAIITPPSTTIGTIELPDLVKSEICNLYDITCNQIYQIFDVPPEVINSKEIKYNSLEQKYQDFLRTAIHPLCSHIAECLEKSLFPPEYMGTYFLKFNYESLLDVDREKKIEGVIKQYHGGILSLNESRRKLGLQSVDDDVAGETRIIPSNEMPFNADTIESFMAKSKLALQEYEDKVNEHSPLGDDKE